MQKSADKDQEAKRTLENVEVKAEMLKSVLKKRGDTIDKDAVLHSANPEEKEHPPLSETRSRLMAQRLSAEGELKSAVKRAEADRRMGGPKERT